MHSATSYFKTLVRSDLRHFWPICFGYTFIWVLLLPVALLRDLTEGEARLAVAGNILAHKTVPALVMAVIFGVVMAMACYAYLMNSRSVGLLHALPARRSTQFFAHFTAGMGMLLGGNGIVFVLSVLAQVSAIGDVAWRETLLWLLTTTLLDLIFFAMAVFCAMFTGWLLAVPVLYAGVNFAALVIQLLLDGLARTLYFGYTGSDMQPLVKWLTPTVNLGEMSGGSLYYYPGTVIEQGQRADFLRAVCIYTAAALVLLGVSYLLYRMRHSEAAGDSVAFFWAKPIFRYVIAVVGGLGLGLGLYWLVFNGNGTRVALGVCLLVMTVICYFAAEMLIRRSLRVFRQGWKGLVAACAVIMLLYGGLCLDVFGVERHVPDAAQVKSVSVNISGANGVYAEDCTDEQTILAAVAAHEAAVAQGRPANEQEWNTALHLKYTMKDGYQVCRIYRLTIEPDTALHKAVNALGNTDSVRRCRLLGSDSDEWTAEQVRGGYVNRGLDEYCQMTTEQARSLFAAMERDLASLRSQNWDVLTVENCLDCTVDFEVGADRSLYVDQITESFKETKKVIETLRFDHYDEAETYVD